MTTINFAAPAILMFSLQPGNDTTALKKATCDERRRPRRATPPFRSAAAQAARARPPATEKIGRAHV